MKKFITILCLAFPAICASAQTFYVDATNSEMRRPAHKLESSRNEVILPEVNGYTVYKADLHTHTIFSDGQVTPQFRVSEAWEDGLDIIAVTEHLEWRPNEDMLVEYTRKYNGNTHTKAINNRIGDKPLNEYGIMVDLNTCVNISRPLAEKNGMLLIPGVEITRNGTKVGHFNALFTTDNNTIFDPDPVQAVRNAKAQGALVMHNHPGWNKTSLDFTPTEATIYAEGLVDGVEVMNGDEFYPGVIDRAHEYGLFLSANTDVHASAARDYTILGYRRPMTLIFAKEFTLEAVRDALENQRTLTYGFEAVCGDEQLLQDFFAASVKVAVQRKSSRNIHLLVTNMSSITYVVSQNGENPKTLSPFHTVWFPVALDAETLDLKVENMYHSKDGHPVVSLSF